MPIFALAVGLVFATILCVAYAAYFLIPGMTLAAGFVWCDRFTPRRRGCQCSLENLRVPKRLSDILEGESLVNDASGLVAYQFAVAAVVTGSFSLGEAVGDFVWMAVGGLPWLGDRKLPPIFIVDCATQPWRSRLPFSRLISPIFLRKGRIFRGARRGCQAYIGHRSWEALRPESRLQRDTVWQLLDYLLNSVIFILIGLQFPTIVREMIPVAQMIFIGVAISFGCDRGALSVFPMASLERCFFQKRG